MKDQVVTIALKRPEQSPRELAWYYLSTVMDDHSRYILAWKLSASKTTTDVTETLDMARAKAGITSQ